MSFNERRFMFDVSDVASGLFCFVIATVSFLYGTRICWVCGKECNYGVKPSEKRQTIKSEMPKGFAVYAFGFLVVFGTILNGTLTIVTTSLISALLLTHFVIITAMPILNRKPSTHTNEQL